MRFTVVGFILVFFVSACTSASVSPVNVPSKQHSLTDKYNQQVQLCTTAWGRIYKQWVLDGGGIKSSMMSTREQIALDKKSIFARIIRNVWSSPKNYKVDKNELWKWPVNEANLRRVGWLLIESAKKYVPSECDTEIWLPEIIWDDMRYVDGNPLKFKMPSEAPDDVAWNAETAPNWIMYWLLAKVG